MVEIWPVESIKIDITFQFVIKDGNREIDPFRQDYTITTIHHLQNHHHHYFFHFHS